MLFKIRTLLFFLFLVPPVFAKENRIHILLTPDEAEIHGIENFPKEVFREKIANEKIFFWRGVYGSSIFLGTTAGTYFFLTKVLPQVGNFFYEEGSQRGYFPKAPDSPPPPPPSFYTRINRGIGGLLGRIPIVHAARQGANAARAPFRAVQGIRNRWNQSNILSLSDLAYFLHRGTKFAHLSSDEIESRISYISWMGGYVLSVPAQVYQAHLTKRYYYQKMQVDAAALKRAFHLILQNADFACREVGGRYSVGLRKDMIKIARITPKQMRAGVFLKGARLSEDDIASLGGYGTFYVADNFKCETGYTVRWRKSINQMIP